MSIHNPVKARGKRRALANQERRRLGVRLKLIREARALSQGQFAARVGISRTTLCNIENHGFESTMSTWILIARALRLPLSFLVKGGTA